MSDDTWYGYLNLFFRANLRDAEVDLSCGSHARLIAHSEYHRFTLDRPMDGWYTTGLGLDRRDPTGGSGTALGDELDARLVWTPWSGLEIMAGFGRYVPGHFVRNTGPAAPATWASLQTTVSW